jgi:arylsulfatase A-like enzyme
MSHLASRLLAALLSAAPVAIAAEPAAPRPNILWITSEDNSSAWLGCYGNHLARTPRLDALAKEGFQFEQAYANAPVCAVARATILTGVYSPTMGTQHMRSRHAIPAQYRPNVEYLRAAGYYCTNNSKTDYNFAGKDASYWDQSSAKAHYRNRPEGKPFFAVFNLTATHESSLFAKAPAEPKRVKPEEVILPPYLPNLPEIRKDYARYLDRVEDLDTAAGRLLDELATAGLAESTIVFYYADHGGVLPRGKRYLEQTGVKVPLIVRIPEKFRGLAPFQPGDRVTEPVSFIDLSPTLLSLAGLDAPPHMQGRPFLGAKRVAPAADEMEFLYADRFDELYGMRRGLTDGKWKYIRNFNPDFPTAPYSFYQFGQPCWTAYQQAYQNGRLSGYHKALWEAPGTAEQLYDLTADPWEMNNLAADPAHAAKLAALRGRLQATMTTVRDTGLVPEPLFKALAGSATLAEHVQGSQFDIGKITDLAFTATAADANHLARLKAALGAADPTERYWGAVGLRLLGEKAAAAADALLPLLKDDHAGIRTTAAEALFKLGRKDLATEALIAEVASAMDSPSLLNLLNTLRRLDLLDRLPQDWAKGKRGVEGSADYIERFSQRAMKK